MLYVINISESSVLFSGGFRILTVDIMLFDSLAGFAVTQQSISSWTNGALIKSSFNSKDGFILNKSISFRTSVGTATKLSIKFTFAIPSSLARLAIDFTVHVSTSETFSM